MDDFEFLRHVTIGQYLPGNSLLHRLDPRAKLLAFLLLVTAVTFTPSYLGNALLLATVLALILLSRISVRYALQGLRPAVPMIAVLAVMQLLFLGDFYIPSAGLRTLLRWGPIHITTGGVQLVVVSICRLVELMLLVSLLTFTTTLTELTHGMESLMSPLARFGFPAHELSLIATIALRFVPILAQELETIVKAQASRGADFGRGGRLHFVRRTRELLPLLVPLFLDAFRRAEDLILAMEARCYMGGRGRTHLVRFRSSPRDYLAVIVLGLYTAFMLTYKFPF